MEGEPMGTVVLIWIIFVIIPGGIIYLIIDSKKETQTRRKKNEKLRKEREIENLVRIYNKYHGNLNVQSSTIMQSESKRSGESGRVVDELHKKAIDVQEQKKKEIEEIKKKFNFEKRLSLWAEECLYSKERVMLCLKNAASKGKMDYCIRYEFPKFPQNEMEKYGLDVYQFLTQTYRTLLGKKKLGDDWYLDKEKTSLLKKIVGEHYKKCLNNTGIQISEIVVDVIWEDALSVGSFPVFVYCDVKFTW